MKRDLHKMLQSCRNWAAMQRAINVMQRRKEVEFEYKLHACRGVYRKSSRPSACEIFLGIGKHHVQNAQLQSILLQTEQNVCQSTSLIHIKIRTPLHAYF